MIVTPVARGPLMLSVHPAGVAEQVRLLATAAQAAVDPPAVPARVLVIGGSTGLGLLTRVVATAVGSATVGVCHSKPGTPQRPGSAGWYATAAVHGLARRTGATCWTVIGDAFSDRAKAAAAATIAETVGVVDLVVYSVAAARRRHPDTGVVHRSVIRTVGAPFTDKTVHVPSGAVQTATVAAAAPAEVAETVAVMGGEDWARWWQALAAAGVLSPRARTIAFSYLGGRRLRPTYRGGTLGAAKDHLEATARDLDSTHRPARVVVTSAHVTQSSAVIPMSALYWMLLARALHERGRFETPLDQIVRMFTTVLPADNRDGAGRLRLDDRELDPSVQADVERRWCAVDTRTLPRLGALEAYRAELLRTAGFGVDGVDPEAPVDPVCPIERLVTV